MTHTEPIAALELSPLLVAHTELLAVLELSPLLVAHTELLAVLELSPFSVAHTELLAVLELSPFVVVHIALFVALEIPMLPMSRPLSLGHKAAVHLKSGLAKIWLFQGRLCLFDLAEMVACRI
jgi:hypothetical protein